MKLHDLLQAVRKQVAKEHQLDFKSERERDQYVDRVIAQMNVLDLLNMLTYL